MARRLVAGGRLRDRFGSRNPTAAFAALGVALLGGGAVVPAFETLLFVWGGTALFVAFLLGFVMREPTVSSAVTTDIYATMAGNASRLNAADDREYVPGPDGVTLVAGGREFDAVGERLLRSHGDLAPADTVDDLLSVLIDVLVNDLELAARVSATTEGERATVTVTGSRIGTGELFDHPVASVIGVGLARGLEVPVTVETTLEDETLVVVAEPTTSGGTSRTSGSRPA